MMIEDLSDSLDEDIDAVRIQLSELDNLLSMMRNRGHKDDHMLDDLEEKSNQMRADMERLSLNRLPQSSKSTNGNSKRL